MNRIKPYILPAAIVSGLLFHHWTTMVVWMVPCLVFTILLLNFSAVDLKQLRLRRLDIVLMMFQTIVSAALYVIVRVLFGNEPLAQGALMCVLCPVASSVVVVTSALGVDRRISTGYTIYGNLLVAVLAPLYFTFIGIHHEMGFAVTALIIFRKIATVIALPFFVALFLQTSMPLLRERIATKKEWALPLWALALTITLGKTMDHIFLYHKGNEVIILTLAVMAVGLCAIQFWLGRRIGRIWNQSIAAGQLLGQKNTGIGIWMTFTFLTPMASVVLAFYAIAQNMFNSWELWKFGKECDT